MSRVDDDMNEVLKSFKKMRMHKKTKSPPKSTSPSHTSTHSNSSAASTSSASTVHKVPNVVLDQPTKDLKKILKLFKKHVRKQLILKKTKLLI